MWDRQMEGYWWQDQVSSVQIKFFQTFLFIGFLTLSYSITPFTDCGN